MRRQVVVSAVLIGLAVALGFLLLKPAPKKTISSAQPPIEVSDAHDSACGATVVEQCGSGSCRVLVVQLFPSANGSLPAVKLNAYDLTWGKTEEILRDVLKTRMNRTAFLTADPGIGLPYKAQMMDVMRRANTERICVIDSGNPPAWYPPRYGQGGGSAGRELPAAAP